MLQSQLSNGEAALADQDGSTSLPGCYANQDGRCSERLTYEHIISKCLDRHARYDRVMTIHRHDMVQVIPVRRTSKILCARHNSALAGIDDMFGRIASFVASVRGSGKLGRRRRRMLMAGIPGRIIERWMLKCLVGLDASGDLQDITLPSECADLLFERVPWPAGWGLYSGRPAPLNRHDNRMTVDIHCTHDAATITSAVFTLRGVPLHLVLTEPADSLSGLHYRPTGIAVDDKGMVLPLRWLSGERAPKSGQPIIYKKHQNSNWDTIRP